METRDIIKAILQGLEHFSLYPISRWKVNFDKNSKKAELYNESDVIHIDIDNQTNQVYLKISSLDLDQPVDTVEETIQDAADWVRDTLYNVQENQFVKYLY